MESEKSQFSQKYVVSWEAHQEPMKGGKRSNNMPTKRWGHSVALYRHYLYLFGGSLSNNYYTSSQSLYIFDLKAWGETGWDRFLPAENEVCPALRDGHSASVIDSHMYIICGSKGENLCNEVYSFDFRSQKWALRNIRGDRIEPREAHVAVVHAKNFIIIHGGLAQNETSQELVAISVKDEKASNILDVKGTSPGMLESHTCVKVNDSFIVYGGIRNYETDIEQANGSTRKVKASISSNEMFSLVIEGTELGSLKAAWTRIEFLDPLPPLNSHVCVLYKDDFLLLIGGECKREEILETDPHPEDNEEDSLINTVFRLNLKTKRINILPQENNEFRARMAHSGLQYKDNIFIFGGLEKGKVFNSQFLRMTVKRKQEEKSLERISDAKSSRSDSKHFAKCKFCPGRATSKITNYYPTSLARMMFPDHSALENKMKRRLTYVYYYISCETENALLYIMSLITLSNGQNTSQETPTVEIISKTLTYTIVPHIEEDNWRRQCKETQIYEFLKDTTDRSSSTDSERLASPPNLRHNGTKSRPSMKSSHLKETGRHHTSSEIGKRMPEYGQRRLTARGNHNGAIHSHRKSSAKESYLENFAQKLSERYKERKPSDRDVIFISLPDHHLSVKSLLDQFNANMMNAETKEPTQVYQEIAALLKLGTECLVVYRDHTDNLLIIYFKRLKHESLDSLGHQFSVVQTHLSEFRDRLVEEYPVKLRLLMKDIAPCIGKQELVYRISNRGQNRHYFVLNPDYLGSGSKRTLTFRPTQQAYELNIEDMSMERFGTYSTRDSVVTIKMPPISFSLFFDFDFLRCSENFSKKLSFVERYESVLRNEKGESFLLDHIDIANFSDYLTMHKKYCKLVEDMISTMKEKQTLLYFQDDQNYLLFDVEVMQAHIEGVRKASSTPIEAWFNLKLLENKIVFYSAINHTYKITNILDLPPTLARRMGWHDTSGKLLGLFAYHSQEEYTALLGKLVMHDYGLATDLR